MSEFQSFISAVKQRGLLPTNRFEVKIPRFGNGKDLLLMCEAIQFPGMALPSKDLAIFGEKTEMSAGQVSYDNITLSFILDTDMRARTAMEQWALQVFNTKSRKANYYRDYVRDVEITVLDRSENGANGANGTRKVTLREAWPKSISELEFNYSSSEVARMRVTLAYKWYDSAVSVRQGTSYEQPSKFNPGARENGSDISVGGFITPTQDSVISFAQGADPLGDFISTLLSAKNQASSIRQLSGQIQSVADQGGNFGSISMAGEFSDFASSLATSTGSLHGAVDGLASVSALGQVVTDGAASFNQLDQALAATTSSLVSLEGALVTYRLDVGGDDILVDVGGGREVWLSDLEDQVAASRTAAIQQSAVLDQFKTAGEFDPALKDSTYGDVSAASIKSVTDSLGIVNQALHAMQKLPASPDFMLPKQLASAKVSQQCATPFNSLSLNTGTVQQSLKKLF